MQDQQQQQPEETQKQQQPKIQTQNDKNIEQKQQKPADKVIENEGNKIIEERMQGNLMNLQWELRQMGFEEYLIAQAIKITSDKDKAIQYIITSLQKQDNVKNGQKLSNKMQQGEQQQQFEDVQEDYKMLFIVRMDLKMGLGKIAAQVAHATLKAYKQMQINADKNQLDEVTFFQWMQTGQKKIVVKVANEAELLSVLEKCRNAKMNTCYIRDAGLTQIAAGSITVGAIGPAASSDLDPLTKHLKLL